MNIIWKNLFDIENEITNVVTLISNQNETIASIEINEYTNDFLKSKNVYGFGDIPTIINNDLNNFEAKINRGKNNKATEYVPYKEIK